MILSRGSMAATKVMAAAAALWLCALAASVAVAAAAPPVGFTIQGRVYCDTCRAGFVTSASEYIAGAKVRLQCKHFDSEEVKHRVEGVTDESGTYRLLLEDDHQEEICEVLLLESPRKDCAEIEGRRDRARVSLTRNNGMASEVRFANPVGFLRDEPLPNCGVLLQQYALGDADD